MSVTWGWYGVWFRPVLADWAGENVGKASEKPKIPVVHIAASYTSTVKVPASAKCNLCPQKMRSLSY